MRYHTATGSKPDIQACYHIMGPQDADQIPDGIKTLLDMKGIKAVAIIYDHGLGERIDHFRKIEDIPCS